MTYMTDDEFKLAIIAAAANGGEYVVESGHDLAYHQLGIFAPDDTFLLCVPWPGSPNFALNMIDYDAFREGRAPHEMVMFANLYRNHNGWYLSERGVLALETVEARKGDWRVYHNSKRGNCWIINAREFLPMVQLCSTG